MKQLVRSPRHLKIRLNQGRFDAKGVSIEEAVAEDLKSAEKTTGLSGQGGGTHAGDGMGHANGECGMPSGRFADPVLETGSYEAENILKRIVSTVNLKGHAFQLSLAGPIGIEVQCPVFKSFKYLVDQCELCCDF
ncbi:MAG: hypothetical protein OXG26_06105 [Caldilineaceae bacterium]|nr:hypothetical protein [Caldilineaceae bacterium]MXZ20928.1 hypothetical protein [Caldilineaceae bacterium SB0665_bin_25]